jgi:hypothetical protein
MTPECASKICTQCGEKKPWEAFSPRSRTETGRRSNCKKCAAKRWRETHGKEAREVWVIPALGNDQEQSNSLAWLAGLLEGEGAFMLRGLEKRGILTTDIHA